ncbi:MAG TPA: DUF1810 domain-containing protein [Terriglobales bacterium]|nr:DUF1810 domain-containing protein [Terriglobales bacterium]
MPADSLDRFVDAQDPVFDQVCMELRAGRKRSHWMWFIFPQITGLGLSAMSRKYAIADRTEAIDYLRHPVLGPRLIECTRLVQAVEQRALEDIFGAIDAVKFRSCMTLFAQLPGTDPVFRVALLKYCNGKDDPATLEILRGP